MSATRSVVVTGGDSGIGRECTRALVAAGRHVVVGSRHEAQARKNLTSVSATQVEVRALDLGSLASVRAFADGLHTTRADRPPLDGLVCNAGVQIIGPPERTADGFERTFGVNHLGHYLLIHRLLEQFTLPARIAIVASGTHDPAQRTGVPPPRWRPPSQLIEPDAELVAKEGPLRAGLTAYSTSKLCNVLCAYALAERLRIAKRAITVNAYDPGLVPGTGLARGYGRIPRYLFERVLPLLVPMIRRFTHAQSAQDAGRWLARLITDPLLQGVSGGYFAGPQEVKSSAASYERATTQLLDRESARLVSLQPGETMPS